MSNIFGLRLDLDRSIQENIGSKLLCDSNLSLGRLTVRRNNQQSHWHIEFGVAIFYKFFHDKLHYAPQISPLSEKPACAVPLNDVFRVGLEVGKG